MGRESEADAAQLPLTLIKSSAHQDSHTQPLSSPSFHHPKSCGDGRVVTSAGVDRWKLTATDLHTGGTGHWVALSWIEAAAEFGSPLRD